MAQIRLNIKEARASGRSFAAASQRGSQHRQSALTGDGLILPAGAEDRERDPVGLQAKIQATVDETIAADLVEQLAMHGLHDRGRRLSELRDDSVSHDWLWRISSAHGPIVPRSEFQTGVRLRVGADCIRPGTGCARCGAVMQGSASHAFCCALPEATTGHYDVRNAILPLAHLADSSTSLEPLGLIPSHPSLRPADLLCSAAYPGRLAALDVGVTSPDASGAGDDCCENMYQRKRGDYRQHLKELEIDQQILYRPLIWSTWGRCHREAQCVLRTLSVQAARRHGLRDHSLILRRTHAAIGVQLVRRTVRMLRACTPFLHDAEAHLLLAEPGFSALPGSREVVLLAGEAGAR